MADVGYMCVSTIISVSAHEFGHALAAARLSFYFLFPKYFIFLSTVVYLAFGTLCRETLPSNHFVCSITLFEFMFLLWTKP